MSTNYQYGTITEELMLANYGRAELATMYGIDEDTIDYIDTELQSRLYDTSVSEEEFQEWCDEIDAEYPTQQNRI